MSKDLKNYFNFDHAVLENLKEEDVESVIKLINRSFAYQDQYRGKPRTNVDNFHKHYFGKTDFYVVKENKKIIACWYVKPEKTALHIGMLAIDDAHRGIGLGKVIMESTEKYARAAGFKALELNYLSVAPWLKKYYERYGFVETGEVIPWDSISMIEMKKELN